jgi:RIO kinase 1
MVRHPKKSTRASLPSVPPTSMSYRPHRFEAGWLEAAFEGWFADGTIADVLYKVGGGKEAEVYCCRAGADLGGRLLAAKVYRPRKYRELANDAVYRNGRGLLDRHGNAVRQRDQRMARAVRKGTAHGRRAGHTSWIMHELVTLQRLHGDGGAAPEPIDAHENAILMAFIGDEGGGAPTLDQVALGSWELPGVFAEVLRNVELLLRRGWTHGDLSPYNLLWWEGRPVIIDLPQVIDVMRNPRGPELFLRDVERVCGAFDPLETGGPARQVADALWDRVFGTDDGVPVKRLAV